MAAVRPLEGLPNTDNPEEIRAHDHREQTESPDHCRGAVDDDVGHHRRLGSIVNALRLFALWAAAVVLKQLVLFGLIGGSGPGRSARPRHISDRDSRIRRHFRAEIAHVGWWGSPPVPTSAE